ncbi:hypothetical protein JTE90_013244 [Oedothorax gibbosus]|uniref:Uncharacterized protein n=1 Tax=Oedothorax gibbosus TaxID=931172 RepID=A0AAV6VCU1_9ARAC|nr:hypothetical protein JTE90_013244 [Oedothorax gibbosus]
MSEFSYLYLSSKGKGKEIGVLYNITCKPTQPLHNCSQPTTTSHTSIDLHPKEEGEEGGEKKKARSVIPFALLLLEEEEISFIWRVSSWLFPVGIHAGRKCCWLDWVRRGEPEGSPLELRDLGRPDGVLLEWTGSEAHERKSGDRGSLEKGHE